MKRLGIHSRLVLAAILLICATTLTLGIIGAKTIHQFVRSRFDERIEFLAKYLSLNAELGILIHETETLERLSRNLLEEQDVVRVQILDDGGEILADVSKSNRSPLQTVEMPVELKTSRYESLAFPTDSPQEVSVQIIGAVRVMYSREGIDGLLRTMAYRLLGVAAAISFVAVMIFYFLSRSLVAPVARIARAARSYASSSLETRPVPGNLPETRELTLAFNSMLDSIEWSNKALEEAYQEMIQQNTLAELGRFSMMVAHEFKNPLSIIKGSLNNLKKEHTVVLADNVMVRYMEEEIHRLNRLIEDFLMFSKPVNPVFRQTDLNETLSMCMQRFTVHAEALMIEILGDIPDEPCVANADRDLLIRVADNLIKNALESSGTETRVRVSAVFGEGVWELSIADQGIGIPEENMTRIFEPFFTTRSKGSGLGLAFASQVVKAHNGTIQARNLPDGGACFTLRLPVSEAFHEISNGEERRVLG